MTSIDKITTPSKYIQSISWHLRRRYSKENQEADLLLFRQEKLAAIARDFINGTLNAVGLHTALRELGKDVTHPMTNAGIQITHEIERLISGHERDGGLTFNEFYRMVN